MKKYELIKSDKKSWDGTALFQIKASVAFGIVTKGELGGYIEKEDNLSLEGDAWVYGNAQVSGNARVYGNAQVSGNARVYGDAWVYGNAQVSGNAQVYGDARVYGDVKASSGWWFAHKSPAWNVTEVEMPDGWVTLVKDYKEPEEELEADKPCEPEELTINGVTYVRKS